MLSVGAILSGDSESCSLGIPANRHCFFCSCKYLDPIVIAPMSRIPSSRNPARGFVKRRPRSSDAGSLTNRTFAPSPTTGNVTRIPYESRVFLRTSLRRSCVLRLSIFRLARSDLFGTIQTHRKRFFYLFFLQLPTRYFMHDKWPSEVTKKCVYRNDRVNNERGNLVLPRTRHTSVPSGSPDKTVLVWSIDNLHVRHLSYRAIP